MASSATRKKADWIFAVSGLIVLLLSLSVLFVLVWDLFQRGFSRIDAEFLMRFPSRFAGEAGILSAWVGSVLVMFVTACSVIPLGIASGVYLEEYAPKNWITTLIELNMNNLAGVPSVIFGLMALGIFVYRFGLGHSILTAGLTLGLLVLPIVIVSTREALRAVPITIREAAFGLGASRLQVVSHHLVPYSMGGILTGVIIALSRAVGETAPLVTIGALTFIAFLPPAPFVQGAGATDWLSSPFTVLPIQMFNWISRPQEEFHVNAAATGLILLTFTLLMNAFAIFIRYRFRKKVNW